MRKKLPKKRNLRFALLKKALRQGSSVSEACREAGLSRMTYYRWLKRGGKETAAEQQKTRKIFEKKLLRLVKLYPGWTLVRLAGKVGKSPFFVWRVLKKLDLNRVKKRKRWARLAKIYPRRQKKYLGTFGARVLLLERGEKIGVSRACREFGVSRTLFYKWQKRQLAGEPLENHPWQVLRWGRQTPEKDERLVLDLVAKNPEFSVHRLFGIIPRVAGAPVVGHHGIQNILRRYQLNLVERRREYARSQVPLLPVTPVASWLGRIKSVWETFVPQVAPAPPTSPFGLRGTRPPVPLTKLSEAKAKWGSFLQPFALSLFSTSFFSTLFIFWLSMLASYPGSLKIGLFFATISLLVGTLFFLYSMKYYFTLALVLSFSSQEREGGSVFFQQNGGLKGWLARIFGLNGGNGTEGSPSTLLRAAPSAGGLQPNLDHIKLERYPFISIHLPFYNEKKVANRILAACTSMDYENYEVIVCDDSNDETVQIVNEWAKHPRVKVLHRPTREGFKGGALRFALRAMDPRTEFVIVFDADFVPYPDTLNQFMKYFKATGGWSEEKSYQAEKIVTVPYQTNEKLDKLVPLDQFEKQEQEILKKNNIAVVAGYQWHVLNKSENWITRGVRTEYAGSYVIERPGQEILGALKIIHGSVYCIRADVLKHFGWGTSITEDFELTLRIYEKGFKVVFTPYIQAPSECVSTIKRLIRQRMRWAEGHSFNVRKMFTKLLFGTRIQANEKRINANERIWKPSPLTLTEKLEFLYISPYYLQAFFFLLGTFSWLISETVFRTRLPFWTSLWGWSLVLTNFFALPLMNAVGLFLEESEEKDYLGILSFIALCYIVVPFQAYAAVKGFIEEREGPWFRTPKTGLITDIFTRGRFYRWLSGILPWRPGVAPISIHSQNSNSLTNSYLALATANNRFANFRIPSKQVKWIGRTFLASLLIFSTLLLSLAPAAPYFIKPKQVQARGFGMIAGPETKNLAKEADGQKQEVQEDNAKKEPKTNELASRLWGSVKGKSSQVLSFTSGAKRLLASNHGEVEKEVKNEGKAFKKAFRPNEEPELIFQFPKELEEKSLLHRLFNLFKVQASSNDGIKARLFDNSGEEIATDLVVSKENEGDIKVKVLSSSSFKPGAYKLKVELMDGGKTFTQEQEFTWGVLAINVNKSIYLLGDEVYIQMAALNDQGRTLCDANLKLEIEDAELEIQKSGQCGPNNVTDKPDYFAYYQVDGPGIYQMKLTNLDNGYEISDSFEVRESVPFEIERIGPTRIYPPATYGMKFKITPNQDFRGEIVETVPQGFEITSGPDKVRDRDREKIKELVWDVEWKAGETYALSYQFDTPDISPYLYLLGPLKIGDFEEVRQWQIAADAVGSQSPTRLWMTGFELRSTTADVEYTANVGTPSISTTTYRSGAAALRTYLTSASTQGMSYNFYSANNANTHYFRAYIYVASAPSTQTKIMVLRDSTPSDQIAIRMNTDRTLELWNEEDSAQIGSDSTAVPLSTWTRIELLFNFGTAATVDSVAKARLEGTEFASATNINHANGVMTLQLGVITTNATADFYWDDVAVNVETTTSGVANLDQWPGAGKIVYLRPNGNGTNTAWTGDYTLVDEITPDDSDTDSIVCSAAQSEDYLLTDSSTAGIGSNDLIRVAQAYVRVKAAAGSLAHTYSIILGDGTTFNTVQNVTLNIATAAWFTNDDTAPRNPATTVATTGNVSAGMISYDIPGVGTDPWTAATLNSAQVRIGTTDCSPIPRIATVWVQVEYEPAEGGRLYSTGFELRSTTADVEYTANVGTPSISTTTYRSGAAALRTNPTTSTQGMSYNFESANTQADYYLRAYIYVASAPSVTTLLMVFRDSTPSDQLSLRMNSSRQLLLWNEEDNAQVGSTSSPIPLATWTRLEMRINTTTLASTAVEGKIDGTSFASGTVNHANGVMTFQIGVITTSATADFYWDDVAINKNVGSFQNNYPGEGKIVYLRPNADGNNVAWTNTYTNIYETTPDDATTLISSTTINAIEEANVTDTSTAGIPSAATINVVQVGVRFNNSSTTRSALKVRLKDASQVAAIESFAVDTLVTTWYTNNDLSPNRYPITAYNRPYLSSAWTTPSLDSAQIGVRLSVDGGTNLIQVSTMWLVVDYTPPPSLNQAAYRWFENNNGTSVVTPLADQDMGINAPAQGTGFRLRALLDVSQADLGATSQSFTLQYAVKSGTCDSDFVGESYSDVSDTSGNIRFNNNATPSDGDTVTQNATYDPTYSGHTNVMERYEEVNPTNNVNAIPNGQAGLWDFSLVNYSAPAGTSYCFRVKKDSSYAVNPKTVKDVSGFVYGTQGFNYGTWDGTNYWIGNFYGNNIYKISPAGTILNTYSLAADINPLELAWDGTYIWVASGDTYGKLVKFNPSTGQTVATYTKNPTGLGAGGIQGVLYDGTNLWIGVSQEGGGAGSGLVIKLDPADPNTNICTASSITDVNGLTHSGSYVWAAANSGGNLVAKIAKSDCSKTTYATAQNAVRLDNDGTYVYVAHWNEGLTGKVYKILMSDGTTAGIYDTCTGANTVRLDSNNTHFWTACDDGQVTVHNASDGAIIANFTPGTAGDNINGLIFDGNYMWVNNWQIAHVYKMNTGQMLDTYTKISEIQIIGLGPSTAAEATAYSFQRKTWFDGTRHWLSSNSGGEIEFYYSPDSGSNWYKNFFASIPVATNDFSIEADSTNAFIVYTDGSDVKARKALSYPGISFSWGSATTVTSGGYLRPTISKDSGGKLWTLMTKTPPLTIRPNANGFVSGWSQFPDSGSHYDKVDGEATDGDNTYLYASTAVDELLNLKDIDGANINSVTAYYFSRGDPDQDPLFYILLRTYDTTYQQNSVQTGTYGDFMLSSQTWTTNPNTLAAWTVTEVNALQVGMRWAGAAGNKRYITQVYVVVDYTPSYEIVAVQSTTANEISAWGTASTLDSSTNSNKYGTIVPSGTGEVYAVWIDATTIEGKEYTSGTWVGSPTTIATGVTGLTNNMSAVSDSSGNVHLLYINSSDYAVYQEYTTSWQTAVTLDSTAGNDYATISLNTSNNDLYALWIRSNVIYYKKGVSPYGSANWDSSATSWQATGTNKYVTSNYSGSGNIFAQWTEGTASPYTVKWAKVVLGATSGLMTAWSFQRKTFYEGGNKIYWRFSYDGSEIDIEYNSSPWNASWTATTSLAQNTNDFSVWLVPGDTYVYICYKTGDDIEVKRGGLTTTAISWGTAGIALNGDSASNTYSYCNISRDSSGYLWVLGTHYDGTNYEMEAADSAAADPATPSFNASTSISNASNTDINTYGVIVPLGATGRTQDMYAVWTRGTTIEGARWDDSDPKWENIAGNAVPANSPDSIATGVTNLKNNMSAVVDSTFDIHLAYIDNNNDVAYKKFDESVPSWSGATGIDTGTFAYSTISLDTDTQDLYVIYMDQVDNSIDYRQYDVSAVQWLTVQSNWKTTTSGAHTTSNYKGAGRIFLEWTSGASSPYTLNWDYIIIPEKLWLLLGLGLIIPAWIKRKKKLGFRV